MADQLSGQGYERFLPFYKLRKRWSDRIKEFDAPLFPGYLFCRFNPQNRLPILKTPGVVQIVSFNNIPAAVDEMVRFISPVMQMRRTATQDAEIAGAEETRTV